MVLVAAKSVKKNCSRIPKSRDDRSSSSWTSLALVLFASLLILASQARSTSPALSSSQIIPDSSEVPSHLSTYVSEESVPSGRQYEEKPVRPQLPPWRPPSPDQDIGGGPFPFPGDDPGMGIRPSFQTEPHFAPVDIKVHYNHPDAIFTLAKHGLYLAPVTIKPPSMQIWDFNARTKQFELLWLNDEDGMGSGAFNLQRVEYHGKPHLLAWSGRFMRWPGYGEGFYLLLDESYRVIFNVSLPDPVDFHDATLTPENTLISTVWRKLGPFDHSRVNGSKEDGAIFDSTFTEFYPTTGQVVFGWSPYEAGISLHRSRIPAKPKFTSAKPWDWAHTNSVCKDRLGNYLVSLRSHSTLFYIDGQTKETLWQLGGPDSNFTGNGNTGFSWQHNALWLEEEERYGIWTLDEIRAASVPGSTTRKKRKISLYDNAALSRKKCDRNESRGLIIELDMTAKTANIVQIYNNPGRAVPGFKNISSTSQGNLQVLPPFTPWDGRHNFQKDKPASSSSSPSSLSARAAEQGRVGRTPVFLAYGMQPYLALYERSGMPLWLAEYTVPDKHLLKGSGVDSYRSYLRPRWRGQPRWPPKFKLSADKSAALPGDHTRMAWISWNGAAGVAEYRIIHGLRTASSTVIPKEGFETKMELGTRIVGMRSIHLEAYDQCGNMLARSPPLAVTELEGLLFPVKSTDKWVYGWNSNTYKCPLPE
ncbi:hypothetical protein CF326_g6643 [Tilletia indica]|nr:hypothetical protein CF326_g6643 [Tilletia indica]